MPSDLDLAADFPAADREQWRTLVRAVLTKSGVREDVDPEEALAYRTYDGIRIAPLYTSDDAPSGLEALGLPGHAPFVRGSTEQGTAEGGWDVRTRHADPDAAQVNAAALQDLETGATSLWLEFGPHALAVDELPRALQGVHLDLAPVVLDAGQHTSAAAAGLLALSEQRGTDPAELRGSFGADPIGARARTGADADVASLLALGEQCAAAGGMQLATVDATVYHDAGASDAQEIGIATAVGVAYLRTLSDGGWSLDDALDALEFRFAVTAEQFPSIAKLRAARRLWHRVAELSGAGEHRRGQRQHAVTSAAMLTRRDPWVNMLRTTIGCFAAAVGGAEAITVAPFDAAIGRSDDFARRIARNTSAVLHDESSLARVVDAAGGSWFVESLTDELAHRAWDVFVAVEKAGGALAALDNGVIGDLVAATQAKRADDIAHRRAPITGVSEFAFVDETPVEREANTQLAPGLLPKVRYAEPFEELRDRSDAAPERPTVYLAALGPVSAHSARAGFAANLFAAGGIRCVTGTGDTDELVAGFEKSGASVACLCSSDKVYAEQAAPVAAALRGAGATLVWLAGTVEADGVDGYLHLGCDALAVLRSTLGATS